jgi:calcium binding protein
MKLSRANIRKLIEAATVDAYNESEQRVGFFTMIEENLALPFKTSMMGVELLVERIDMNAGDEIVAVCRNGHARQRIRFNLLDLRIPTPRPVGAEWIEAYRQWAKGLS